ncbi:MAG TPA: diguanylate cyclase [Candidatus Acidoferrales bacterium]|jgi:diguanylate cyclase (GGDEF)-like protein/putative nucleotidyltransferase with HDIG domain|nr:diguanylate cyclase [Candidatus Acidoferrales bacterium]
MVLSLIALGFLLATVLVGVFFASIHSLKRQLYLLFWAGAWLLFALHLLPTAISHWTAPNPFLLAMSSCLFGFAGIGFFLGTQLYMRQKVRRGLAITAAMVLIAWASANALQVLSISAVLPASLIYIAVAVLFWRESRHHETLADQLLAIAFAVWGLLTFALNILPRAQAFFGQALEPITVVPTLFVAMLLLMANYEEEKRRVERNMLALSNLNLATSSFVGGEIQRMLSQALDRVLGVIRLPAGVLFLHHGDPAGPSSVVSAGISDDFCRAAQTEGLDEYLVGMVSRLGGLLGFRDLRDDNLSALEKDEPIRRFRELALQHGLRSAVVISLQAKEQAFGLLLLGTPDSRRFTPAELRLLLALGHQIGVAVENSYLIQQTSRRSEELHVLNEIGRALSSTLNKEDLLRRLWEELRRLFDVENLYLATFDSARDQIQFDLELMKGVRMPKRSRAAGNHLTEYILRTRQPVLIRDNFVAEVRKLGIDPIRTAGSFCGVPLVAYDHAMGALCIYSDNERAYDEGHLELMRVLASEASIAIENARLFQEERTKARHLSLLNLISRDAIATLNPDEILAKIAGQLEHGLSYDHIGIAILEYTTRELVVSAESGKRRGALGRRIPLDTGLIGQVARTGKASTYRLSVNSQNSPQPVLSDSCTAMALPIFYGDHLHGVMYVETLERTDFSEEESLLLHTLTDLIAGAYHNAQTFQRAQEQAITDGLTGVKTHRFFMEALSSEWKRSSRAGRSFALVLMDLDRFKFVNDFYGHLEGDLVLQRVGQILETNCRRSDVVARYGGDEFVILMPETTMEQARQLSSKLRGWIASDPLLREKNISASFGIASYPLHGSAPQELIQVADASMYLSKHQGGNTVSTAEHIDPNEARRWKRDVLEAYLGVTLKRLFSTGPEAFEEIYQRLRQFSDSLPSTEPAGLACTDGPRALPQSILDTVTSLAYAIDAKDQYTQGHSQKVSAYAALLAEALGMSETEVEEVRLGAVLHDVGKVGIPEQILNKSGPLNPEEWETMKTHVTFGGKLLEPLEALERIRQMVLHHHEFFDGSGYPEALSGHNIPLGARIITIADSYDTITSDRSYKKGRTAEEALAEVERCAHTQFDPELVVAFLRAMRQLPNPIIEVNSLLSRNT